VGVVLRGEAGGVQKGETPLLHCVEFAMAAAGDRLPADRCQSHPVPGHAAQDVGREFRRLCGGTASHSRFAG